MLSSGKLFSHLDFSTDQFVLQLKSALSLTYCKYKDTKDLFFNPATPFQHLEKYD